MKTVHSFFIFFSVYFAFPTQAQFFPADLVDPFIGTGAHGHTYPGATLPFGMVQLSPDTRIDASWDGCSGYHYSDSLIYGFSHTHLNGTGCYDYGDIMLMPMMDEYSFDPKVYSSFFSHGNESAKAGYYAVQLDDDSIQVELTATTRVGLHRYSMNKTGTLNMLLDLAHRDKLLEGNITQISDRALEGCRRSKAWAVDQLLYYRIEFSKPFSTMHLKAADKNAAAFTFSVKKGESILVKVSISAVDNEGAKKNMETELPGWDFDKTKQAATHAWNEALKKIEVSGGTSRQMNTFYTALYHTMLQPNIYNDVDGRYRGRDKQVHQTEGGDYYTVFSLWDTFRAAHPLYTIIEQKRTRDFINTFLAQYEQGGRLPVWELSSNETDCMIGYHAVSVIADAAIKGIKDFNMQKALQAMIKSATWNHFGVPEYIGHGYLEMDDEHESVSKTLEYAYDDWCISQMALLVKHDSAFKAFNTRAHYYKNIYDPVSGFMRPKKNGGWYAPFDPREVNNNFTEANSWQYSFFVPHDIPGLIQLAGGPTKFEQKLDALFTANSETTGREQADITGLIGQYAHGNEPSHHMAYLYNYINRSDKTQYRVKQILDSLYRPAPDGLSGNEDCGQMSAWYVMSAIGIYQVTPGRPTYTIGSPLFPRVKIHLENGNTFEISSSQTSKKNTYIQSAQLNGKLFTSSFLQHEVLMKGGLLAFDMGNQPHPAWCTPEPDVMPVNSSENFIPVPVITGASLVFKDKEEISMNTVRKGLQVWYFINNETKARLYKEPITIKQSTQFVAYATDSSGRKSFPVEAKFRKIPNNWKITLQSQYTPQYSAGGSEGLIDGVNGDINWKKGDWQGYQGQNFEAIIDLGGQQTINYVSENFLQDTKSWIIMPQKVEFSFSKDGKNFFSPTLIENTVNADNYTPQVKNFSTLLKEQLKARYVKIVAESYGKLPAWHEGKGSDAYIFTDEIIIR